jgi:predicted nucleic acid-binding protein
MHYGNLSSRGAWDSIDKEREVSKIQKILENVKIISFDHMSATIYDELYCQLKSNMIKSADLLIASMVLSNSEVLLTKDDHFRRISSLSCESW